jgi:hypothetical protein
MALESTHYPTKPVPEGYPSADQSPQYPDSIQQEFKEDENFISFHRRTRNYNFMIKEIFKCLSIM